MLESAEMVLTSTLVKAGLETRRQRLPSQCSTTAFEEPEVVPTTQALFAAGAVTALRELFGGSVGLATTLQLVPFQCAMNGGVPTAQTSLLAAAATLTRGWPGRELGTTLQLVPSKCSVSARGRTAPYPAV